jgi:hypothetical protein
MTNTTPIQETWQEEFCDIFIMKANAKNEDWRLTYEQSIKILSFIESLLQRKEREAYVKGYQDGGGNLGKRMGKAWCLRKDEKEAIEAETIKKCLEVIGEDEKMGKGTFFDDVSTKDFLSGMVKGRNELRGELRDNINKLK